MTLLVSGCSLSNKKATVNSINNIANEDSTENTAKEKSAPEIKKTASEQASQIENTSDNSINSNNAWGFTYIKDGKGYAMVNGKEYGPYNKTMNFRANGQNWGFEYSKDGTNWTAYVNGTDYGAYTLIEDEVYPKDSAFYSPYVIYIPRIKFSKNYWGFCFKDPLDNKSYVIVNGKKYGPFDRIVNSSLILSDNNWGALYVQNHIPNVIVKGEEKGQIKASTVFYQFKLSDYVWMVEYVENTANISESSYYVIVNGEKMGPFSIEHPAMNYEYANWSIGYFKQDKKYYINLKGKEYGPYDYAQFRGSNNHWVIIKYRSIENKKVIGNIIFDGIDYGDDITTVKDEDSVFDLKYNDIRVREIDQTGANKDVLWFVYSKGDKKFLNLNGKEIGPYDFIMFNDDFSNSLSVVYMPRQEMNWIFSFHKGKNIPPEVLTLDGENLIKYDRPNVNIEKIGNISIFGNTIEIDNVKYGPFEGEIIAVQNVNDVLTKVYYKNDNNYEYFYTINAGKKYGPYMKDKKIFYDQFNYLRGDTNPIDIDI